MTTTISFLWKISRGEEILPEETISFLGKISRGDEILPEEMISFLWKISRGDNSFLWKLFQRRDHPLMESVR
jgi:hypothetical protein